MYLQDKSPAEGSNENIKIETKYFKNKTQKNYASCKKRGNVCSKLYKKRQKKIPWNLGMKKVTDITKFWKTVIPSFSDKM